MSVSQQVENLAQRSLNHAVRRPKTQAANGSGFSKVLMIIKVDIRFYRSRGRSLLLQPLYLPQNSWILRGS